MTVERFLCIYKYVFYIAAMEYRARYIKNVFFLFRRTTRNALHSYFVYRRQLSFSEWKLNLSAEQRVRLRYSMLVDQHGPEVRVPPAYWQCMARALCMQEPASQPGQTDSSMPLSLYFKIESVYVSVYTSMCGFFSLLLFCLYPILKHPYMYEYEHIQFIEIEYESIWRGRKVLVVRNAHYFYYCYYHIYNGCGPQTDSTDMKINIYIYARISLKSTTTNQERMWPLYTIYMYIYTRSCYSTLLLHIFSYCQFILLLPFYFYSSSTYE